MLRHFSVFNAHQADRLPAWCYPAPGETAIAEPQAVVDDYLARGPQLRHAAGDAAHYNPATDTITLPARSQFASAASYYATAFHECGHSTGHPSRLNRPGIAEFDHFGSARYAREELVAQMTSAMLCAETGIETAGLIEQSAAYVASWLRALRDDRRLAVTAAAQAQKASDPDHRPRRPGRRAGDVVSEGEKDRQMTRACVWARVSTTDQRAENQLTVLREWAQRRGLEVVCELVTEDSAWQAGNGAKGREFDAARAELLNGARLGHYQVVLIWALDRLSRRGAEDTLATLRRLSEYGIDVRSHQEDWLRTSSPEVRELLIGIFAWLSRQESARRSERIKAGLARRKSEGKPVGGRKLGAKDKTRRGTDGYVTAWQEGGKRREALERAGHKDLPG